MQPEFGYYFRISSNIQINLSKDEILESSLIYPFEHFLLCYVLEETFQILSTWHLKKINKNV